MLISRLIRALQDQRWSTVSIEFAILVAGVYLGLQADEWRVDRERRADLDEQVARILTDARFLERSLDGLIADTDEDLERFALAQAVLDGRPIADASERERFDLALIDSFRMDEVDVVIPSLERLIETGDLHALEDPVLEEALVEFVNYRRQQGSVVEHIRHMVRDRARVVMDQTSYAIVAARPAEPLGMEVRFEYDLEELRAATGFRRAVGNLMILSGYLRIRFLGYRQRVGEMVAALESHQASRLER